jgi:hypothetical protein
LYEQVHVYTGDRKNQHFCAGSRAYVCCCCLQLLRCLLLLLLLQPSAKRPYRYTCKYEYV